MPFAFRQSYVNGRWRRMDFAPDSLSQASARQAAIERLAKTQVYLQSLDSVSFQMELSSETAVAGKVQRQPWRSAMVKYQPPNRLLIKSESMILSSDGDVMRFVGRSTTGKQMYMEYPSPSNLHEIPKDPNFRVRCTACSSSLVFDTSSSSDDPISAC